MYIVDDICYAGSPEKEIKITEAKPLAGRMLLVTFSTGNRNRPLHPIERILSIRSFDSGRRNVSVQKHVCWLTILNTNCNICQ